MHADMRPRTCNSCRLPTPGHVSRKVGLHLILLAHRGCMTFPASWVDLPLTDVTLQRLNNKPNRLHNWDLWAYHFTVGYPHSIQKIKKQRTILREVHLTARQQLIYVLSFVSLIILMSFMFRPIVCDWSDMDPCVNTAPHVCFACCVYRLQSALFPSCD